MQLFCEKTGSGRLGDNFSKKNGDARIYSSLIFETLSMQLRISSFNLSEIYQQLSFKGISLQIG